MAVDEQEKPHASPDKPPAVKEKKHAGGEGDAPTTPKTSKKEKQHADKKEEKDKPSAKKQKAAPESAAKEAGAKRKGLYDAAPVVEGKRERKQVERLEVAAPVKSPEPTVKEVRARGGAAGRAGRGREGGQRAQHGAAGAPAAFQPFAAGKSRRRARAPSWATSPTVGPGLHEQSQGGGLQTRASRRRGSGSSS